MHSVPIDMAANSTMLRLAGSVQRQPHGKFPTVSINDNGTTVGLHQPFYASTVVHYQVGTIRGDEVDFSESRLAGKGRFPKVALNNENQVVQVHEGRFVRRIFYNVGVLNNLHINWGQHSRYVCWGRFPAVAIHDNRVVMTYDCAYIRHSTYYRIGTIKSQGRVTIDWGDRRRLFRSAVTETAVSISKEYAVAVGRGWIRIKCPVGQFQEDGSIDWMNEVRFDRIGFCPTICLDNDHYVIMVWQSFTLRRLSYVLGRIITHDADQPEISIDWYASRDYDYGYNPTIALSPNNGQVLEEHETNRASCRCTLHYHTGILHKEDKEAKEKRAEQITGGQALIIRETGHGEGQLARETEEVVADVGQPTTVQGVRHLAEETGEEQPVGEIGVWYRDLRRGRNVGQEVMEMNPIRSRQDEVVVERLQEATEMAEETGEGQPEGEIGVWHVQHDLRRGRNVGQEVMEMDPIRSREEEFVADVGQPTRVQEATEVAEKTGEERPVHHDLRRGRNVGHEVMEMDPIRSRH